MIEFFQHPRVLEAIGLVTVLFLAAILGLKKLGVLTFNEKRCTVKCPDPDCRTSVVQTAQTVQDLHQEQREIKRDVKELTRSVATIEAQVDLLVHRWGGD